MDHKHDSCCSCGNHGEHGVPRRSFLAAVGGTAIGSTLISGCATTGAAAAGRADVRARAAIAKKELVVQPVFLCSVPERREKTSWRSWGDFHNQQDVDNEIARINGELAALTKNAEFALKFLPLERVNNREQANRLASSTQADSILLYPAMCDVPELEALISPDRYNILFVRHESGPAYLLYETASCRLLRKTVDGLGQPGLMPNEMVVDSQDDLLWRFRSMYALKNTLGSKIVAIGDASGWGAGGQKAPQLAKDVWKLDIIPVSYDDLGKRIQSARSNSQRVGKAQQDAAAYLSQKGVTLSTDRGFVDRAFLLTEVIRDLMDEAGAQAMTINNCMSTIMPMSETTACMPLSLINDSGLMAFCESDFVVIPSGILLHHVCGLPVFLQDPTFPHHGKITVAHCTAPRKMDGEHLEPVNILTHYESDYGAAPKVDMRIGQTITMIDPDFEAKKWIGFRGKVLANPFMAICRSQSDVSIEGDCDKLAHDMVGFHWMLAYGDHRKEIGYAINRLGIQWDDLTEEQLKKA